MVLLQSVWPAWDIATMIIFFIIAFIAIALQVILIRWVFRIDRQVENQNAQIWLLMKLCEKSGLTEAELTNFKQAFNIK